MVWSQYSILNIVIHGAQTPKYKIVYVNHLPEYCPVMNKIAILANLNRISNKENKKNLEKQPAHVWSLCACLATLLTS